MSSSITAGQRPLAIVTGASTGIGYELAKCCAREGFNLLVAADEPAIQDAAEEFRKLGAAVYAVQADLSTTEGVDALYAAARGRPVETLLEDEATIQLVVDEALTDSGYAVQCASSAEKPSPCWTWLVRTSKLWSRM